MTQSRQESAGQGLSIKLNKDKTKCRNIHIGFNLAVFLCLQIYANVLHDMLRYRIFGADDSSKAQLLCFCMLLDM